MYECVNLLTARLPGGGTRGASGRESRAHLCAISTDAEINLVRAGISSSSLRYADSGVGGRLPVHELLEGRCRHRGSDRGSASSRNSLRTLQAPPLFTVSTRQVGSAVEGQN